jgi:hypothetical protein
MDKLNRTARVAFATAVLALVAPGLLSTPAQAGDLIYQPGTVDPVVGMNIWKVTTTENVPLIEQQVQQMHASGLRQVTFIPVKYANVSTGVITATNIDNSRGGMTDAELGAGIAKAKSLGMTVTVDPIIQPSNDSNRALLYYDPITNSTVSNTFWSNYGSTYASWANVARQNGANRFNVGSEMEALEGANPNVPVASAGQAALQAKWGQTIDAVDNVLGNSVKLGYHSNHWSFANQHTKDNVWNHTKIDYVSLSAYYDYDPPATFGTYQYPGRTGLASPAQGLGVQPGSESTMVSTVETNFRNWIESVVLGASTKPIVIQEFGIAPFNQATAAPWEFNWNGRPFEFNGAPRTSGTPWPYDAFEARDAIEGVLRALSGKGARIEEVNFWLWQWSGGFKAEPFGIRPGYILTDDPNTTLFDETKNQQSSDLIAAYLQTIPEPSTLVGGGIVLCLVLRRVRCAT